LQATLSREDGIAALDREIAARSFVEFCSHVTIRSDDPLKPEPIKFALWPKQKEFAEKLETGESFVLLKERQIGMTWLDAAYLYWRVVYHGWACGYFSKGQLEARKQVFRVQYIHNKLPKHLQGNLSFNADEIRGEDGAGIQAFPSTEDAGVSYTLQLAVMDEAAFHPYGEQNYDALKPAVRQLIIQSTADPKLGPSGFMHDTYFKAEANELPFESVFFGRGSRPDRDEAWYIEEEKAYAGRQEAFNAYYPQTPAQAFAGRKGLVYPKFRKEIHVKPAPCKWRDYKWRIAGVDLGGGDPTAITPIGITGDRRFHQHSEYYKTDEAPTVTELGAYLLKFHREAPFEWILCPPEQAVTIASLQALGLPAKAADNSREHLGLVAQLLAWSETRAPRLTIDPKCEHSIAEFATYRWKERKDTADGDYYATSTPSWNHGDAMDARRYALVAAMDALRRGQGAVDVEVKWDVNG
jgi:hypothetical protein